MRQIKNALRAQMTNEHLENQVKLKHHARTKYLSADSIQAISEKSLNDKNIKQLINFLMLTLKCASHFYAN